MESASIEKVVIDQFKWLELIRWAYPHRLNRSITWLDRLKPFKVGLEPQWHRPPGVTGRVVSESQILFKEEYSYVILPPLFLFLLFIYMLIYLFEGMFPYMCLATLPIFCRQDWPKYLMDKSPSLLKKVLPSTEKSSCGPKRSKESSRSFKTILMALYILSQLALPWTHNITQVSPPPHLSKNPREESWKKSLPIGGVLSGPFQTELVS